MSRTASYQEICDAVFKAELRPAAQRWIAGLSPEELARFRSVFPLLAQDAAPNCQAATAKRDSRLQPSRYSVPEWRTFGAHEKAAEQEMTTDSLLARATSSHLTYGTFDSDQMRTALAQAVPTRTRESDKSQINATERSEAYMARWSERMMNTTYRDDICHSGFQRTVRNRTSDQTVVVYSKATLNAAASERAKGLIDKDPVWTRSFRELCRSLADSVDSSAYRSGYTTLKKATGERHAVPRWTDPVPVSRGLERPAETFWQTTHRSDFVPSTPADDEYRAVDQHRACYSRPFDLHPKTEKLSSCFRDDYLDHMKNKDDQPEYWKDMRVIMPAGSGVVGSILGRPTPP